MPTVTTPLPKWDSFQKLKRPKKVQEKLAERVRLGVEKKRIEERLETLNYDLFGDLRMALPDDVKSIDYEGYQVSCVTSSPRKTLDRQALMETPFKHKCPSCSKVENMTIPPSLVDECMKEGKTPEPTISVRKIGKSDEE